MHDIATRLDLSQAGTYVDTAKELGIEGDLYAILDETFRAMLHSGPRRTSWGIQDNKGEWLLSYLNQKRAYAWHLAVADDRARENEPKEVEGVSNG